MAEYYPLLVRAVASLPDPTPEARASIYERARKALIGQLRSIEPPIAEEDIERESRALDEAVARIEAEQTPAASQAPEPVAPPPPAREALAAPQPEPAVESASAPPKPVDAAAGTAPAKSDSTPPAAPRSFKRPDFSRPDRPRIPLTRPLPRLGSDERPSGGLRAKLSRPGETPVEPPPSVEKTVTPGAESESAQSLSSPATSPSSAPAAASGGGLLRSPMRKSEPAATAATSKAPTSPVGGTSEIEAEADAAAGVAAVRENGEVAPVARNVPGETKVADLGQGLLRKFGRARLPVPELPNLSGGLEANEPPVGSEEPGAVGALPDFDREPIGRPTRPLAPQRKEPRPGRLRHIFVALVLAIVVGGVAVAAWMLRDRPQDLTARHVAPVAEQASKSDKIIERIGVGKTPDETAAPAASTASTAPAPAQAPAGSPTQAPAQTADQSGAGDVNPPVPVAQRAALLVQAPTETNPQAVATYVGTVVWSLDKVAGSNGKPDTVAVRATIDVPQAKLKASMVLSKNNDPTLPASHLVDLHFTLEDGSPIPAVKQVDAPQMRREDNPSGDSLAGLARPVSDNYFLIALAQGDNFVSRNIDLMKTRGWFDIPMLLADNKIAKITFEKGPSGDRVLDQALADWSK